MSVLSNVVFLIGSAAIMIALSPRLFLVSVAAVPASVWALQHYQHRLAARVRAVRERSSDIGSFLLETLLGIRLVVSARAESREVERFRARNQSFLDALMRMQLMSFLSGAVPGTILTLSTAAIFLYGGKLVIDGALTTGSLVALMSYHLRLLSPVQNLMSLYSNLVSGGVSLSRVWELFDTRAEIIDRPGRKPLGNVRGEIEFDRVSFGYGGDAVLEDLSFRVAPGTICAILGPSGAGKSTLADLLVRFYDPDAGAIRIDGRDLRDLPLADVRHAVMLVDQAPYLFHASVRENIAYARPEATDDEIVSAAQAASIHERILALPDGYDTVIAERGQTLSAGERQRIALARALLANPKVLVLDEPTSALDEANERAIAETLVRAAEGRTAILITHRASLARIAHQTIFLDPAKAEGHALTLLRGIRRQPFRPRQLLRGLFDAEAGVVVEEAPFSVVRLKARQQRLHQRVTGLPGGLFTPHAVAQVGKIFSKGQNILSGGDTAVSREPRWMGRNPFASRRAIQSTPWWRHRSDSERAPSTTCRRRTQRARPELRQRNRRQCGRDNSER